MDDSLSLTTTLLYSLQNIDYHLHFPAVFIDALLIWLSARYVSPSLVRTYTLNISIVALVCALYGIARTTFEDRILRYEDNSADIVIIVDYLVDALMSFPPLALYEIQGTLIVVLAFYSCTQPIKYKQYFRQRNVFVGFLSGNLIVLALAIGKFFESTYHYYLYNVHILRAHVAVRLLIEMTLFSVMLVFYFKTLKEILPTRLNELGTETERFNRIRLRSVLIYCTPPNFLLVFGIVGSLSSAYVNAFPIRFPTVNSVYGVIYSLKCMAHNTVVFRLLVSSVSIIFAFQQYRQAVKDMTRDLYSYCKRIAIRKSQSHVSTASNSQRSHNWTS
ncbi:hypothetical protein QR680_006182 [Steinernema hermaphroditum]|uniref:Uncharacterized protein n=1 Tax=Steinernema hermaphroditum TaxID=289476 RepID=A0AA39LWN9_9BILA|nr:hypothetical protein QR680_006182 [Steinernema hermaphroditum]